MRYLRYKKFMCALLASAMVVSGLPADTAPAYAEEADETAEETQSTNESEVSDNGADSEDETGESNLIASISFDDSSLEAEGANVTVSGTEDYEDDTESGEGKSFYFNGKTCLTVTDEDGGSLLSGHDELTISYRSKPTKASGGNWPFFAAHNSTARSESNLHYIGVLDGTDSITAERFGDSRTTSLAGSSATVWKNVTIVYEEDTTTLYINGKKKTSATGCIAMDEVLGDSSILQLGKANWGSGEYYKGYLDEIKIYDGALDAETIKENDTLESKKSTETVSYDGNDVEAQGEEAGLTITEISELDTSDIHVDSVSDQELPSKVEVTLSNGKKRDAYVSWTDSETLAHISNVNQLETGKNTLTGRLSYYPSPLVAEKADPFIIYNEDDGYYYMTSSWPAYGSVTAGYDRIALRKSKTILGLQDAEDVVIWEANDSGALSKHIWAPELHKVGDTWVVYFAGTCNDGQWSIGAHCLVCSDSDNLLDADNWSLPTESGQMQLKDGTSDTYFDGSAFSLDMTYFENEDVSGNNIGYVVWAYKPSASNLMIAEVDMDEPWKLKTDPVTIAIPSYSWEKTTNTVNEGPAVLKNGDNIYIAFSADGTGDEYKVGLLTADNDSDLLDPDSWTKDDEPIFSSDDLTNLDEYGPGHNSFTVDEDGNVIIVYHARDERCHQNKCDYADKDPLYDPCRNAEINYVSFDEDGKPVFNETAANQAEALGLDYNLTVYVGSDAEFAAADAKALNIPSANDIRGNITLPEEGKNGSEISWTSTNEDVVSTVSIDNMAPGVVTRQAEDTEVTLTASIKFGSSTVTKVFNLNVKAEAEEVDPEDYIFVHFVGETYPTSATDEQIYFSSSTDGRNFTILNSGKPIFTSTLGETGLRDPSIIRSPEGDKFYLIATDLSIYSRMQTDSTPWPESGVNGSHSIAVYESTDLVNWSDERLVEVAADNAGMAWAPEAVYDEDKGEYFVFWSSTNSDDSYAKHRVYCATTRDFYTFSEPQIWIENTFATIDTSVIKVGDWYYRISKNESTGYEYMEKSQELMGEWEGVDSSFLSSTSGVEGGMIYKVNPDDAADSSVDEYCMILDRFATSQGYFPAMTTDIASGKFTAATDYSYPSKMRHGSVLPITAEEYEAIQEKWASTASDDDDDEVSDISLKDSALFNLSFDGDEPLSADGVKVVAHNAPSTVSNSELGGKALSLSASDEQYLDIQAEDGTALLTGQSEVTINYWSKVTDNGGWAVFAAPYADAIKWGSSNTAFGSNFETYLGIIDTTASSSFNDDGIFVQRFMDSGTRSAVNSYTGGKYDDSWKMITVVAKDDSTELYVNGEKISTVESSVSLEDLFGDAENGIFRIGRASWDSGEYFNGLIDDITVYNRAVTSSEVANIYSTKSYTGLPEEVTHEDFDGELPEGAKALVTGLTAYSKDPVYGAGHTDDEDDQAILLGDYGVKLANENLGDKYTLSFWTKPTGSVVVNSATVFLGYNSPEKWLAISGADDGTKYKVWTNETDNSSYSWTTIGNVTHEKNEWKMITITQDGNSTKVYENGELTTTGEAAEALNGENQGIYLGVTYWDNEYVGYIDDLYLYDEVLDASQVYSLYDGKTAEDIFEEKGISTVASLSLKAGKTGSVELSVPSVVKGYTVSYNSSDESVATVKNGTVTAVAEGSCVITTSVTYGSVTKTAETNVTVEASDIVNTETAVELDFSNIDGTTIPDKSGNKNSAVIKGSGVTAEDGVLNLTSTGYVTLPLSIMDALSDEEKFTIECTFSRDASCGSNAWAYCIGSNPLSTGTNYLFLSPAFGGSTLRSGIKNSSTEILYDTGITTTAGKEYTADMVFDEGDVTLYLNGVQVGTTISSGYSIADIIENGCKNDILGYLGKSCWSADPNFTGTISKFAVYNGAKTAEEIQEPYAESFQKEFESLLTLDEVLNRNASADEIYFDLNLVDEVDEMDVVWTSSDEEVIATDGTVADVTTDTEVTLTATVTEGNLTASQKFVFTVKAPDRTELDSLLLEAADILDIAVNLNDSLKAVKEAVEAAKTAATKAEIAAAVEKLSAAIKAAEADTDYLDPFEKVDDSAYSESMTLEKGESKEIIAISDDISDCVTVKAESSDTSVATAVFADGKATVKAVKAGTAEISVTVTSLYDEYPVEYVTEVTVTDSSASGDDSEDDADDDSRDDVEDDSKDDNTTSDNTASDNTASDNTASDTTETVVTPKTPADGILSADADNLLLAKNKYYIRPSFAVKKYVISNKKIVKVTKKGKVKVKKTGTATVTAVGKNGESAVYTITAEVPKMKKLKVTAAGTYKITEMLTGVTYAELESCKSSKTSVAEIAADGTITVKAKGSTKITVVIGGKKYKATLKAKF
ncbi:LamG-like jellyroll fold domain-containing protein [Lachnospiraceae bacterium C1.1]|nr:family 43 glycosylhydrolase [Lachnospiraceae bacterium C1.1]